jgi:hypothetical protein
MELDSPIGDVLLHWWPRHDLITGFVTLQWCFTRSHTNNVKSWQLHHPSGGGSEGFALTMWKADVITHHRPSPVPFCSLQDFLLLTTQWPVRAMVKLLGGTLWMPCFFTPTHSLTGPVGQPFASSLGGINSSPRDNLRQHDVTIVCIRYPYKMSPVTNCHQFKTSPIQNVTSTMWPYKTSPVTKHHQSQNVTNHKTSPTVL